jgi:thiol-disulfide isomerase/thioredoxin
MKTILSLLLLPLLIFSIQNAHGQEFAMDFQQEDCEGISHQLFTELNAGKVVVLDFVMLNCAPCIVGTNALENIAGDYESSHPGRVAIYSFGFLNSYTCEQLLAWKNDNSYIHPVFNNGEDQVDYYGGMGMPTIVVIGTDAHRVFFKSIGYTPSIDNKIREAIDTALLYSPTGINEMNNFSNFRIYPTLTNELIRVETGGGHPGAEFVLHDTFGRQVLSAPIHESGAQSFSLTGLASGVYFARIRDKDIWSEGIKLIIP